MINLPLVLTRGWDDTTLNRAIQTRKSVRHFRSEDATISVHSISQLLYAAYGMTRERRRSVPSAGALYPLTIYVVVQDALGVYVPSTHSIELVKIANGVLGELLRLTNVRGDPLLCIVISADFMRTQVKYGERGRRYVWMECGHSAQNIQLEATILGLCSVCVGAFSDGRVKSLLEIQEDPLYIIPVGFSAEGK